MKTTFMNCILLCILMCGCSKSGEDKALAHRFFSEISKMEKANKFYLEIDLREVAKFQWDSVYFFNGEESADFIYSFIKTNWNGPDVPNQHKRFVFLNRKKVVGYFDINEFDCNGESSEFPPFQIEMFTCPSDDIRSRHRIISSGHGNVAIFRSYIKGVYYYSIVPLQCSKLFNEKALSF